MATGTQVDEEGSKRVDEGVEDEAMSATLARAGVNGLPGSIVKLLAQQFESSPQQKMRSASQIPALHGYRLIKVLRLTVTFHSLETWTAEYPSAMDV